MDLVRVNIEEAIQAIQVVRQLDKLEWDQIEWFSNGRPVIIADVLDGKTPPFGMSTKLYLEIGHFVITPKVIEEIFEDE